MLLKNFSLVVSPEVKKVALKTWYRK